MKKLALFLALCMVFTLVLAGCQNDSGEPNTNDPGQSQGADNQDDQNQSSGEKRTDLHLAMAEVPSVLDPHYANLIVEQTITSQIYEALIFIDDDGTEYPCLATDYTISDDGLVYTFNLRQGVKFHNGEEFKASDVVFSIERCRESARMYSYVEPIASVEAPDDYTAVITLSYQYAPFIQYVGALWIVNEKHVTEVGKDAFATDPCGTGPYMLKSFEPTLSTSVTAFSDYWGGQAPIKDIDWKIITDTSTALVAFEAGEIDYIGVPSANWEDIKANSKYTTELLEANHTTYLVMNHEVAPFDNKLVRQALNYAINKDDMCLMAKDGLAAPAYTLAKETLVWGATNDTTVYEYDVEKAKAKLAEAGYPDGFDAGAIKTIGAYFEKVAQIAQSNFAAIGVTTTVEMCESSAYMADCIAGNIGLAVMGVTVGTDFAMFDQVYATQFINNLNLARYSNPTVDDLFKQGVATTDHAERQAIYKQLIDIVQEDAVYIPVFYGQSPVAYNPNLSPKSHVSGNLFKEWSWK